MASDTVVSIHLTPSHDAAIVGGLAHRGGLRAQIVTGGVIRVGDAIDADARIS